MTGPVFEFSEVFNEDYLYFYGPQLEAVSDAQAETIWRLLDLEPGMEVLDLACGHGNIPGQLARRVVLVEDRHAWRHCVLSGLGLTGYWSCRCGRARSRMNSSI